MGLLATKRDLEQKLEASEAKTAELEKELRTLRQTRARSSAPTATANRAATGNATIRQQYKAMAPGAERRAFRLAHFDILAEGGEA